MLFYFIEKGGAVTTHQLIDESVQRARAKRKKAPLTEYDEEYVQALKSLAVDREVIPQMTDAVINAVGRPLGCAIKGLQGLQSFMNAVTLATYLNTLPTAS